VKPGHKAARLPVPARPADGVLTAVMMGLLLFLVCCSPWVYGAVHPGFEFLLDAGVALLLVLWAVRMLLEWQVTWNKCPVVLCLAGLFLLALWQITPIDHALLARLSPATANLYDRLLPHEPEVLPLGEQREVVKPPPGSTLSVYPTATRRESIRILCVFLVFVLVLNNLGSSRMLRWLSIATLINGALLALFALIQFFSSQPNTLYWRYRSMGTVFGPFVNRNHFACYMNLCIGLGVGLLLTRRALGQQHRRGGGAPNAGADGKFALQDLFQDPVALWASVALAIMVSSVLFSMSRGGFLALISGALVCVCLLLRASRSAGLGLVLVVGALAVGLVGWLGYDYIQPRLESIWGNQALENRLPVWFRSLCIARDFPLWGTGYGTFEYAEAMYRSDASEASGFYDHAHNDYLEALTEGGIFSFLLVLLAAGLVYAFGFRAVIRHRGTSTGGLALGALFAYTTLLIHSCSDFSPHIPAVALLATVVGAFLCALGLGGDKEQKDGRVNEASAEYRLRLSGLAPLLATATVLCLGLLVCASAWKAHLVDRWKAAAAAPKEEEGIDSLRRRIDSLSNAVTLAPDNAPLQADLGTARLALYTAETAGILQRGRWAGIAGLVASPSVLLPAVTAVPGCSFLFAGPRSPSPDQQDHLERRLFVPALRAFLRARDVCPLLVNAQLGIAGAAARMTRADPPTDYTQRVKELAPGNPEAWYQCGQVELASLDPKQAWASYRHSLELSEDYLPLILAQSNKVLSPEEMLENVLSNRPEVLLAAASRLYPNADQVEERRPFLEKALALLGADAEKRTPAEWHTQAVIQRSLGELDAAASAYETALAKQPLQTEWRFEFARVLYERVRLEDARRQLVVVLTQQPRHAAAQQLLTAVKNDLARKG
jgi:O-antigen ligase/tetratricopeptide (TPR) repeat protein